MTAHTALVNVIGAGFAGVSLTLAATFASSEPAILAAQTIGVLLPAVALLLNGRPRGERTEPTASEGGDRP